MRALRCCVLSALWFTAACGGGDGKNGEPGDQGDPGDTGADGRDGANGEPGAPGSDGATGERGDQGGQGDPGEPGEQGTPGEAGTDGDDGSSALLATSDEAPGANCQYGGTKLEVGVDADGSGILDAAEVDLAATSYVCLAAPPSGVVGPSCAGILANQRCESVLVPGASFCRNGNCNTTATLSPFYLDKYEVTVARFRKFVSAYTGTAPASGAGAHPLVAGTGWQSGWNSNAPASQAALIASVKTCGAGTTWTDAAGANEALPMNCVHWYDAFQFCAWDGGHLATEAEWELAAVGGAENRRYPWGGAVPTSTLAVFNCTGDGSAGCVFADILPVGSTPAGNARWGHSDLAGSLWEWHLDAFADPYPATCADCATAPSGDFRTSRGGAWSTSNVLELRGGPRNYSSATYRADDLGFRCAR